jgi:uncharacterized protein YggE
MPLTLALLGVALLTGAPAPSAAAEAAPRPATLTVSGQGTITRAPDRVVVSFRVESIDAQAARATAQNTTVTTALHDALTRLGIAPSAISTGAYAISYNPRPPQPDPNVVQRYGYIVDRIVIVTVDRTDTAGPIVDAGVGAGVTGVNGVSFELRDPRAAYRAAQIAALGDAQEQARALAGAAHVRLVRLLDLAPSGGLPRPVPLLQGTPRMALAAAAPTQLDPANLTASATVTLRYEIAP